MAPSFHLLTWSEITVLQSGQVFSLLNHKEMHSSQNVCWNEKNDNLELLSSSIYIISTIWFLEIIIKHTLIWFYVALCNSSLKYYLIQNEISRIMLYYLTDQQNRLLKFSLANGTNIIRFRALSLAGWHPIVL